MTPALRQANVLWRFLTAGSGGRTPESPRDLIVVCCSYDLRVCDHACRLLQRDVADRMLITGQSGHWTRHLWDGDEADVFAARARALGVETGRILIERKARSFADNIAFSRAMCPEARRVTFVTKPQSVRRVELTVPIRWPGLDAAVDAPAIAFPSGASNAVGILGLIEEMVGDLHRILVYPRLGFQVPLAVPGDVLAAWRHLIALGFDRHLAAGETTDF